MVDEVFLPPYCKYNVVVTARKQPQPLVNLLLSATR